MIYNHFPDEAKYLKRRKKRKIWRHTAAGFSVLTALCTIYLLIIPAITMKTEENYICGKKEHTHNEACYAKDQVLICEQTEHMHAASCSLTSEATMEASMKTAVTEWQTLLSDRLAGMGDDWGRVREALEAKDVDSTQKNTTITENNDVQNAIDNNNTENVPGEGQFSATGSQQTPAADNMQTASGENGLAVDGTQNITEAGENVSGMTESPQGNENISFDTGTDTADITGKGDAVQTGNITEPTTEMPEAVTDTGQEENSQNDGISNPIQKQSLTDLFKGFGIYEDITANYVPQTGDFVLLEAEQGRENMAVVVAANEKKTTIASYKEEGKVVELNNPKITGYGNLQKAKAILGSPTENNGNSASGNETGTAETDTEQPTTDSFKEYVLGQDKEYPNDDDIARFEVGVYDKNDRLVSPMSGRYFLTKGEFYRLHFVAYAPDGLPYEGKFFYDLPGGMEVFEFSGKTIQANDGEIIGRVDLFNNQAEGKQSIVADMITNRKIRVKVEFDVNVRIAAYVGTIEGVEVQVVPPKVSQDGEIQKQGELELREDGMYAVWNIIADIPGHNPNAELKEWYMTDWQLCIPVGSIDVDWNKQAELKITVFEGDKRYRLKDCKNSSDQIAYYIDNSSSQSKLYLVNRGHEECEEKIQDTDYCGHWIYENSIQVTVCYETKLPDGWTIYTNTVVLSDKKVSETVQLSIPKEDNILNKKYVNSEYKVIFNESKLDLSDFDELTLKDTMTGALHFEEGSMTIIAEDVDGISKPLQYGSEYTVEVLDEAVQQLEIKIKDPGAFKYTLIYNALVGSDVSGTENNEIEVTLGGQIFKSREVASIMRAEEFCVTARKSQRGTENTPVAGAEYAIFSSTGQLKAKKTTDENGNVSFESDPASGFGLRDGKLYYIQEIKAPDGYFLDETKYWFYIEKETGTPPLAKTGENAKPAEEEKMPESIKKELRDAKYNGVCDEDAEVLVVKNAEDSSAVSPIAVSDEKIYYLPKTGSSGLIVYTAAGFLLIMAAVCIWYNRKREWKREEMSR